MLGFTEITENFQNPSNAQCTGAGAFKTGFDGYMQNCLQTGDINMLKNVFDSLHLDTSDARQNAGLTNKEILDNSYNEAIMLGDNMASLGSTTSNVDSQLQSLENEKRSLTAELRDLTQKTESADRTFLDTLIENEPKYETIASLQDVSLATFWLGWFIVGIVLVLGKLFGTDGSLKSVLIVFMLYVLVSILVYGLLKKVA
jgi:hypothetical protein